MVRAVRGELFKALRRPSVWVCIVALVLLAVLISYVLVGYVYSHPPKGATAGLPKGTTLADFLPTLYPANFVRETLGTWGDLGGVFALIIGVLLQGSEYGWGTVKMLFTQRAGRFTMLAGKLITLAVVLLLMVLALFAATAAASFAVASLEGADTSFPAVDVIAKGIGTCFLVYGLWSLIGLTLATLFRQSAMAIGLGLAYGLVIERTVFGLLGLGGGDWVNQIHQWFPMANVGYLVASFGEVRIRGVGATAAPYADATHGVIILVIYLAAFVAITLGISRARDVTS
ncbi:MAG: ABC transporter permease subunit [Candidatus Dormibacterales bacterium]